MKKRVLKLGPKGELLLPPEALDLLGVKPGGEVALHLDDRKRAVSLERHVSDPWAEALREKEKPEIEDLFAEDRKRQEAAKQAFEQKLKNPPKSKPEDKPDLWR